MVNYDLSQSTIRYLKEVLYEKKLPEEKDYFKLENSKRIFYNNFTNQEFQSKNAELILNSVLFRSTQDNYFFDLRHNFIFSFEKYGVFKYFGINLIEFFNLEFSKAREILNKAFIIFDTEQILVKESYKKAEKEQAEINKINASVTKRKRK